MRLHWMPSKHNSGGKSKLEYRPAVMFSSKERNGARYNQRTLQSEVLETKIAYNWILSTVIFAVMAATSSDDIALFGCTAVCYSSTYLAFGQKSRSVHWTKENDSQESVDVECRRVCKLVVRLIVSFCRIWKDEMQANTGEGPWKRWPG